MNTNGTGLIQFLNNSGMDYSPAWSPDGKKIAFFSNQVAAPSYISVMNADGSDPARITRNISAQYPSWGPLTNTLPEVPAVIVILCVFIVLLFAQRRK